MSEELEDKIKERDQLLEHLEKMYSILSHIQKLVEKSDNGNK